MDRRPGMPCSWALKSPMNWAIELNWSRESRQNQQWICQHLSKRSGWQKVWSLVFSVTSCSGNWMNPLTNPIFHWFPFFRLSKTSTQALVWRDLSPVASPSLTSQSSPPVSAQLSISPISKHFEIMNPSTEHPLLPIPTVAGITPHPSTASSKGHLPQASPLHLASSLCGSLWKHHPSESLPVCCGYFV